MSIAKYIDHTILKQDARKEDIERITAEAREYGFASVCVNSCWVKLCHSLLEGTDVKVCTVVGFPLGAASSEAKKSETAAAVVKVGKNHIVHGDGKPENHQKQKVDQGRDQPFFVKTFDVARDVVVEIKLL